MLRSEKASFVHGGAGWIGAWLTLPNLKYPKCWQLVSVNKWGGGGSDITGVCIGKGNTFTALASAIPTLPQIDLAIDLSYAMQRNEDVNNFQLRTIGGSKCLQAVAYSSAARTNYMIFNFKEIDDPTVID